MAGGRITNASLMGICNIHSSEYAHTPQEKKPLLLPPLRKSMKERKPMIVQSLHQPVSTYTGCTNKTLQWNSQKLGHSRTQTWNFIYWEFLPLGCNICLLFFFFFSFLTAFWGVLHLSCLLVLILVLFIYLFISLAVHLVFSLFCVFISHARFHFSLYLFVSVELSFLDFLSRSMVTHCWHLSYTAIYLVSSFILTFIFGYLYHSLI